MPELPEVETVRRCIAPRIVGRRAQKAVVRDSRLRCPIPSRLPGEIAGGVFTEVRRRGKYLLADFCRGEKEHTLIVHLGMSGALFFSGRPPRERHEHFGVLLEGGEWLIYKDPRRFGCILSAAGDGCAHPLICNIGAEPLTAKFNGAFLRDALRGRKTAVKNALMNGGIVAGVGNIYASESLFAAGIRPQTVAGKLNAEKCATLAKAVKHTLRRALRAGGSTMRDFSGADGEQGMFQMEWKVYGRAGMPCLDCGAVVRVLRLGGRASYFCPRCQPAQR